MYTDLQINFIRAYGDKELKFGCFILHRVDDDYDGDGHIAKVVEEIEWWIYFTPATPYWWTDNSQDTTNYVIIWGEPQWHDVFKKLKEIGIHFQTMRYQTSMQWYTIQLEDAKKVYDLIDIDPCLPLLEQPEVMEQLLSLIK